MKKDYFYIFILLILVGVVVYQEKRLNDLETEISYLDTYSVEQRIEDVEKKAQSTRYEVIDLERKVHSLESTVDILMLSMTRSRY
jgi:hypothetical protein